jgi:hypothetical protein
MVNKKILWGMAALALTFGLAFAGCNGGGGAAHIPAPSNVKAFVMGEGEYIVVTWDAVDVVVEDYEVVSQKQGKKTVWGERAEMESGYTFVAGAQEPTKTADPDKWIGGISSASIGDSDFLKPGDKVRFGVITTQLNGYSGLRSSIAWSGYITVPAEAAP